MHKTFFFSKLTYRVTDSFVSSLSEGARIPHRSSRPVCFFFTCGIYIFPSLNVFILCLSIIHSFSFIVFSHPCFLPLHLSLTLLKYSISFHWLSYIYITISYSVYIHCSPTLHLVMPPLHLSILPFPPTNIFIH